MGKEFRSLGWLVFEGSFQHVSYTVYAELLSGRIYGGLYRKLLQGFLRGIPELTDYNSSCSVQSLGVRLEVLFACRG